MSYEDNKKLTVFNFWAGPGAGKSLNAAGLFNLMKKDYKSVELITEYAKDLVWSERNNMFTEQDYIFAKQNHRLRRLVGKVEYAITDSPLALGMLYLPKDYPPSFKQFALDVYNTYNNVNIYLNRNHPYQSKGRNQTEEEAKVVDEKCLEFLDELGLEYISITSGDNTQQEIYDILKKTGRII